MKPKRYWLRGGISLVVLAVCVFLVYTFIGEPVFSDDLIILLYVPGILLSWPILSKCFLAGYRPNPSNCPIDQETYTIVVYAASILAYFIIGALIGWIYGKIKNRNK